VSPETFRYLAKHYRGDDSTLEAGRLAHSAHVGSLLDEIACRMERGERLNAAPAFDICYAISGSLTLSEVETLALRVLEATRPMFSVPFEQPAKSVSRSAVRERQVLAEGR
jgi:hypothetical protein